MPTEWLLYAGAGALVLLVGISFLDGILVHLFRERLHARPESRLEHHVHTARAFVFAAVLVTVLANTSGWLLWIGIVALAIDQVLETIDMAIERRSRRAQGGLKTDEYLMHGTAIALRAIGAFVALAVRPLEAYALGADVAVDLGPLASVAWLLLPGTIVVGVLHVALSIWPRLLPVRSRVDDLLAGDHDQAGAE